MESIGCSESDISLYLGTARKLTGRLQEGALVFGEAGSWKAASLSLWTNVTQPGEDICHIVGTRAES